MAQKEIKILQQQIDKLYAKDFELQPWKNYTIIILDRIFGRENEKIKMIRKVEFEFSSWSLRDASGNESYEEGSIKLAREILQAAIDELKAFGLPERKDDITDKQLKEKLQLIFDEFKGTQIKHLKSILSSNNSDIEKKRLIIELISEIGNNSATEILTNLIMMPDFSRLIIKS